MSALINDLLAYSRMERRTLEPQAIDVDATVARVLDEYAADIERSGAQVEVQLPDALSLTLDREGLTVVLRNLVGNALKFARPGQAPRVQIGARREAGHHLLWVRDEGVGFDMKYHERIFGIFQRLQRAEDYPGTGVGLALVAKAVQRMGGRVWADSQPGAGATFFLEFPA
jgi:signal transduction histidine kinase